MFMPIKRETPQASTPLEQFQEEQSEETSGLEAELQEELEKNADISEAEKSENIEPKRENSPFPIPDEREKEEDYLIPARKPKEKHLIDLDWEKSKTPKPPSEERKESPYLGLRKSLNDLIGMIVNMIGRNIDELKIAQALKYRCKEDLSEETIIQLVLSIKEFLKLCQQHAFDNVRRLKELPSDEECILHLIAGDTSYAMALLEALMDEKINQAVNLKNTPQRNGLFKQASDTACTFGTLAELRDVNLASASFELAIEMYPDNTLAWSRCADLYKQTGLDAKAQWAYKNVLKIAEQGQNKAQEANARKVLSQYLYDQGEPIRASELYIQSKTFYDSIGINRPLDRKELEIIELIDNTSTDTIIHSALHNKQHEA